MLKHFYIIIGMILLLSSCYREMEVGDLPMEVFELSLSPEMEDFVFNSTDTAYVIEDPELSVAFNEHPLFVSEMRVRGRTTLDYRRKSFSLKLDSPVFVPGMDGQGLKELTRFKLISLSMDYTYINNRLAFGILEKAGVMPLFYKYVGLSINGENQGVYFLVEDPEQYAPDQGSEFILRRDYNHSIEDSEYKPGQYNISEEDYLNRFKEMYTRLPGLKGPELYEHLDQRLDLQQYFRKMGIEYFLKNGDYTDELYFYSMVGQEGIRYRLIPWDYDDIFSYRPHEVGRYWGTGTIFGERRYESQQDVFDEIGDRLVFSIEDDLDYIIAVDSFLYASYEKTIGDMMSGFGKEDLNLLFDQIEKELRPFYNIEEVILQSQYDQRATSTELWQENMAEKKELLTWRLDSMKEHLKYLERSAL